MGGNSFGCKIFDRVEVGLCWSGAGSSMGTSPHTGPRPAPGNRDIALEKVAARGPALASWLGTLGMQTGN